MFILYILLAVITILLVLLAIACIRTLLMPTKKADYKPNPDPKREKEYAEKLGVDAYIRKPFPMDELIDAIERVLNER